MKRKSRKIIFYASLLIFIIAGPLIVVYNYGYRVDFENKTISAVGGISIITRPKGTKLFINDNLYKEKGAYSLSPNFFVQNLIPKKYKFTVAKDGYWSWEKTFQIRPREITKAELIVLFEKNPLKEIFFENSGDIYQSDSERKIAFIEKIDDAKKNFVIIDLENPNESSFLRMEISYIENPVIISWNSSENKIIIFDTSNKKYFIANTAEKNIFPLPDNLFFNNEPLLLKNPRFNNVDNDNIFFADNGKLYKYNPGTKELDKLIDDVMSWSFINDTVFYIKNNGFLYKNNSLFTEETGYSSSQIPFFVKNQEYKIISSRTSFSGEQYIAVLELEKSKRFFMINNGGYFDFIDQGVKNIIFSWDLKKILLEKDHELEIFYLKEVLGQPHHDAKEKETVLTYGENIGDARWLMGREDYIIMTGGNMIKIMETDTRDRQNIINFIEASNLNSVFYYGRENAVYYQDGTVIYRVAIIF